MRGRVESLLPRIVSTICSNRTAPQVSFQDHGSCLRGKFGFAVSVHGIHNALNKYTLTWRIRRKGSPDWIQPSNAVIETTKSLLRVEVSNGSPELIMEEPKEYVIEAFARAWQGPSSTVISTTFTYESCAQDCELSLWAAWGACASLSRRRSRRIVQNADEGGQPCGDLEESQACSDCQVSAWQEWSACSQDARRRQRDIQALPTNGGKACPPLNETESCAWYSNSAINRAPRHRPLFLRLSPRP